MGNEMVVDEDRKYPMTAMGVVAQVRLIAEVMNAVMKKETHYGVIPGCAKPSLWKPGAEKLLVTFRIATESAVEDLSTHDEARYRVTRRATAISNGAFLGSAAGECSSSEEKYKWRGIVCDAEYDATPEDRRRLKFKRDGSSFKQVRTNHADVANTILKMADKRAYVAIALQTTAASDIFTQDVEDLPEEVRDAVLDEAPRAPIKAPVAKVSAAVSEVFGAKSDDSTVTFIPVEVTTKNGEGAKGPWTKYGVKSPDGKYYGTFTEALGELAQKAAAEKFAVTIKWEMDKTGKYFNIVTLTA